MYRQVAYYKNKQTGKFYEYTVQFYRFMSPKIGDGGIVAFVFRYN